jgi:putative SOS response-associated peptidase YedK
LLFFVWRNLLLAPAEEHCCSNDWVNRQTGEQTHTFSIITTPANALMSKIHNDKQRMPFILPKGTERDWLNTNLKENEITDLIKPLPEGN